MALWEKVCSFFFFFFFFLLRRQVKLEIITKNQRLAPKMESKGRIMSEHNEKWKAEEAIGGNRAAVEALRELITFPLLYSSQAQKLGLKVSCNLQSFFILIYSLLILISGFFFFSLFVQWPRGLLLYGPPGTGKVSLSFLSN